MSTDMARLPWRLKDLLADEGFFDDTPDSIRDELAYWSERVTFSKPCFGQPIVCTAMVRWCDETTHDFTGTAWNTTIAMALTLIAVLRERTVIAAYRKWKETSRDG